jgi:lipid II:glycine glycyltransferase (peptidoglycan interpeptide bridge formation enzyme)
MPEATIIIQVDQSIDELSHWISSTHHRRIKKAQKSWGKYIEIRDHEINLAYEMRYKTSKKQWFTIPLKQHFLSLCNNLISSKNGFIAARKQWDELGAFAVILTVWKTRFYLYGWSDSCVWVWSPQALHWQIIQNAHHSWIKQYDLLWVSPKWQPTHHLAWVTQFKQGFGWEKAEYLWNYDYLISGRKYRLYKIWRNLRK